MVALTLRLAILSALPYVLVFLVDAMPGLAPAWDFANAAGLFGGVILLLLFVYCGRPMSRPYFDGKFFMVLHRDLGYAVLILLALHVGLLLVDEPLVVDYLLPSASLPMLAGTLAALLLLILVPISLPAVRQRLWRHHLRFRRWHYGISSVLLVLLAVHVIGTGFYTGACWKAVLWGVITSCALIWPLLPRSPLAPAEGHRRRNTGGLASRLCAGLLVFVLCLAGGYALLTNSDLPL
ncbi:MULTISPECIES: ferric reductase-like transmembrane domain-containing protein [unclassified Pseudomonas]|uniref:ferric reductase-like transmembrane domain-containing protein n=1 Tax=unclassified Pseudomonas TaxID=196821 RepID=UPI000EA96FEF|nr:MULTISPECIES: ferric reductase-like transmembrane domain-containing protein [unclassified Pseudomonas]AYF90007.1 ferric reductase like transmembrane component [Pseudomonas sp. DY-1]MDH4652081.1 ferric reductase like transmembrane component [Pseudomonas sp. BN606]MRK22551.1 ferric reductase like transmembrane component [Pseudomonas sp. JG-B]